MPMRYPKALSHVDEALRLLKIVVTPQGTETSIAVLSSAVGGPLH